MATSWRRTGCSRWICGAGAARAGWPRSSASPALEADVLARTMDLPRLAAAEDDRLPAETRGLFEAFSAGVNAAIRGGARWRRAPHRVRSPRLRARSLDCARLRALRHRVALAADRPAVGHQRPRIREAHARRGAALRRVHRDTCDRCGRPIDRAGRCGDCPRGRPAASPSSRSRSRRPARAPASVPPSAGRRRRAPRFAPAGARPDGRQQQLGRRRVQLEVGPAGHRQRSAHALRVGLVVLRDPPFGPRVRLRRRRVRRLPRAHLRTEPSRRVGHHEQHLLAARPVPRSPIRRPSSRTRGDHRGARPREAPVRLGSDPPSAVRSPTGCCRSPQRQSGPVSHAMGRPVGVRLAVGPAPAQPRRRPSTRR